jgi:hypothetical protein
MRGNQDWLGAGGAREFPGDYGSGRRAQCGVKMLKGFYENQAVAPGRFETGHARHRDGVVSDETAAELLG